MFVSLYGDSDYTVAACLFSISETLFLQGKLLESKKISEQCLSIRQDRIPVTHADMGQCLLQLGINYTALGMYDKALPLCKKAFKVFVASYKTLSNCLVADAVVGIAEIFRLMGYSKGAESLHSSAHAIRLKLLDRNHPSVATSMFYLNCVYFSQGLVEKAIQGSNLSVFSYFLQHFSISNFYSNFQSN